VVAAGTYFGATVNKAVTIEAKAGDTVIINDGPNTHAFLRAGFYFAGDYSGNGATISGFDIQGAIQTGYTDDGKLDFAIFSRGADNVVIDNNTISDMLQGITNWHGDGWHIADNEITDLWTLNGGGIGILVGANDGSTVTGNIISDNSITGTLSVYSGGWRWLRRHRHRTLRRFPIRPRWGRDQQPGQGQRDKHGQRYPTVVNFNGIELVDTRDSDTNPSAVLNNQVVCNSIHNNSRIGVYVSAGTSGNNINFNSIVGNQQYGVRYNGTGLLDAENNWWGDDSGPAHSSNPTGTGDAVSDNVDFAPWGAPAGITFPHGMFSFQICCLNTGETVTLTVTLPSNVPVGTRWWKYHSGSWYSLPIGDDDGDKVITVTLQDGGTGDSDSVAGQITDPGGPGWGLGVGWETQSVSKLAVMTPWIALLVAIVAGAGLLVWRRRRVEI
jgi:hypothetical protein